MKKRMGFVANSSSVAYIVDRGAYRSVFALAAKLISRRDFEDDKQLAKRVRSSKRNHDMPIAFSTMNCFTTIDLRGDKYYVCTDQNHSYEFNDELEFSEMACEDNIEYPDKKLTMYYPEYEVLGREYLDKDGETVTCGTHFTEKIILENGSIECPACYYNKHLKYRKLSPEEKVDLLRKALELIEDDILIEIVEKRQFPEQLWKELDKRTEE